MIDYSEMSDKELNVVIAEKRGWEFYECIDCGIEYWILPDGGIDYNQSDPPDYTHDWNLCGELLEEMLVIDVTILASAIEKSWMLVWWDEHFNDLHEIETNNPKRAICEAWPKWSDEK